MEWGGGDEVRAGTWQLGAGWGGGGQILEVLVGSCGDFGFCCGCSAVTAGFGAEHHDSDLMFCQ